MNNLLKNIRSWKTSISGIIAGLLVILPQLQNLFDGDPETALSETAILTGLALMGIGVAAKDGDKSTEDVSK